MPELIAKIITVLVVLGFIAMAFGPLLTADVKEEFEKNE
jgi:hypothetical protein